MKKTIFLSLAFLFTTVFNYSFSMRHGHSHAVKDPAAVATLIINADVTVVLVNGKYLTARAEGDDYFMQQIEMKQTGNELVISAKKNKNLKKRGVIYVPADQIGYIKINSSASVQSLNTLKITNLDVVINGPCELSIANIGKLNVIETEFYTFESTTQKIPVPASFVGKRNN